MEELTRDNISQLMAESAVSVSFGQDWACFSEGELALDSIGHRRMHKNGDIIMYI